jgi:hypothetical protein
MIFSRRYTDVRFSTTRQRHIGNLQLPSCKWERNMCDKREKSHDADTARFKQRSLGVDTCSITPVPPSRRPRGSLEPYPIPAQTWYYKVRRKGGNLLKSEQNIQLAERKTRRSFKAWSAIKTTTVYNGLIRHPMAIAIGVIILLVTSYFVSRTSFFQRLMNLQ